MTSPPENPREVPAYVALVRIAAVIGMSATGAFGLFLFIAAAWLPGLISIALATPFYALMRLVEHTVEPRDPPSS